MVLNKRATAVLFAGLLSVTSQALLAAESVNFVSWGGSTQDAQKQAWADPFSKASGITVVQDGPTDYGKLKAMVESGNVQWDVVDVEADFALRAAAEGHGVVVVLANHESSQALLERVPQLTQPPRQFSRSQSRIYSEVGTGAQILQNLGVGKLRHLGPPLKYAGLTGYDLEVVESIPFTD